MTNRKYNEEDGAGTTHFGFEKVTVGEKAGRVAEVFDTVSQKYDIMNDVISFGTHRVVKWYAINASNIKPGSKVLDIAAGTGDLSILISKRVGPTLWTMCSLLRPMPRIYCMRTTPLTPSP